MFRQSVEFPTCGMKTLDVLLYQNCNVFSTRVDDFDKIYDCSDLSSLKSTVQLKYLEVSPTKEKFYSYTSGDYSAVLESMEENFFEPNCYKNIDNLYDNIDNLYDNLYHKEQNSGNHFLHG